MQSIIGLSLTPNVNAWLANSRQPRVLHVFEHACNLINERKDVFSVVIREIGNGPFNLVVEDAVVFSDHLSLESPIFNSPNLLNLGDLTIHTHYARLWSPRPDWEILHAKRNDISKSLLTNYQKPGVDTGFGKIAQPYLTSIADPQLAIPNSQSTHSLASALANADLPAALNATQKLAGLGIGLTPSGDDFIMGAILAAWIIHPVDVVGIIAAEVTEAAAAVTTSLSGALLRSAGRGDAGILWHQFFDALLFAEQADIQESMDKILSIGETSGADALLGFLSLLAAWSVEART
ncbi:MAG: DUF2877 domain-containing protein [Chloroflexota bacterium]|nr:DUF2877 domain-containing protein [Chloroflexota bacterium]